MTERQRVNEILDMVDMLISGFSRQAMRYREVLSEVDLNVDLSKAVTIATNFFDLALFPIEVDLEINKDIDANEYAAIKVRLAKSQAAFESKIAAIIGGEGSCAD